MSLWVEQTAVGTAGTGDHSEFERYCQELVPNYCPYIAPAIARAQLSYSEYRIQADTVIECQAAIMHTGSYHAERVRNARRQQSGAMLQCDCPLFEIVGPVAAHNRRNLFERPHLLLMLLYAPVGVIVGRFWPGPARLNAQGLPRPVPPTDLLAVRSALPSKDERFFEDAPVLHREFIHGMDDGRDVLAHYGGDRQQVMRGQPDVAWYEALQAAMATDLADSTGRPDS